MIYLDNAATTYPKPGRVLRAALNCMTEAGGNPGRAAHRLSMKASRIVFGCREEIARTFGGQPENVVFTANATAALNLTLKCFAQRLGHGHILISGMEHNAVLRPVERLKGNGMDYSCFSLPTIPCPPQTILDTIERELRPDTRILCAAHASNVCGIRLPVREIGALCKRRGIIFILDAAQSAGVWDIQLERDGVSALCCPAHKGLYGMQGLGFALFDKAYDGDWWKDVTFLEGGSGSRSLERTMPSELPERFEAGTPATPAIAALWEGLRFVAEQGEELHAREQAVIRAIRERLLSLPDVTVYAPDFDDSTILLFNVKDRPSSEVAEELDEAGICVRSGFHCAPLAHELLQTGEYGAVRVSASGFNSLHEADVLWKTVRQLTGRQPF